jgi:four helix bundle protein
MPDPSKLLVLDKAHTLLEKVNDAASQIHKSHLADLKKQLMKSALSIPSNIAEGRRKESQREFLRFLDIALGSTGELETQLRAAKDCRALPLDSQRDLAKKAQEVGKMLTGLRKKVANDLTSNDTER